MQANNAPQARNAGYPGRCQQGQSRERVRDVQGGRLCCTDLAEGRLSDDGCMFFSSPFHCPLPGQWVIVYCTVLRADSFNSKFMGDRARLT